MPQSAAHVWETLSQGRIDTALDLDRSNGLPDLLSTAVIAAAAVGAAIAGFRIQARCASS